MCGYFCILFIDYMLAGKKLIDFTNLFSPYEYFESEIKERNLAIKKLSKYITGFDYCDKILTVFLTVFSGVSILSHLKTKKHTGLVSSILTLFFSLSTGIIKKLLYETKKRKKKHNKILYLGKNK